MRFATGVYSVVLMSLCILLSAKFTIYTTYLETDRSENLIRALSSESGFLELEIPQEDLFKDKNGVTWMGEFKEVVLNNHFYEVVKISLVGSHYAILVKEDKWESNLFSLFLETGNEQDASATLVKLLLTEYQLPNHLHFECIEASVLSKYQPFIINLSEGFMALTIKPPLA